MVGVFELYDMTNEEFCRLYSAYNGEKITHIDKIVSDVYDGRDLKNFIQYILNSKLHQPTVISDVCGIHSTDLYGKCFKCGEQVFNINYDNKQTDL